MFKILFLLLMAMLFSFSTIAYAERMPLTKFIRIQLMSSKYDYAEKKFTGIIFHYGTVTIDPDKMSLEDMEALELIMKKGRFMESGKIHDVGGVKWIVKAGLDQPMLFTHLMLNDFVYGNHTEILSPYPNMRTRTTYSFQRYEFPIIPEYLEKQEEKGMKDSQLIAAQELDRITNSKMGSTPGVDLPGRSASAAPTCSKLF